MHFDVGVLGGREKEREIKKKQARRKKNGQVELAFPILWCLGVAIKCGTFSSSFMWNNNWPNGYRSSSFERMLNSKNLCCVVCSTSNARLSVSFFVLGSM